MSNSEALIDKSVFFQRLEAALAENSDVVLDGEGYEKMHLLAERLVEVNRVMNLTAITDMDGIVLRHVADSLIISPYIPEGASLIDIGCGAGFPTLPLAVARPDLRICAVDSTEKRVKYVTETAKLLDLANVKAISARAEELALLSEHRERYDVATARAVASLPVLCELTLPFVKVGGTLVAMKAKSAKEELEASCHAISVLCGKAAFSEVRFTESRLVGSVNGERIEEERAVIEIPKLQSTPRSYPRKYAQIKKSPL